MADFKPGNTKLNVSGTTAQLLWNQAAVTARNAQLKRQQAFVDSEVLRRCSPRVPKRTGALERSGTLATVIGSGEVNYNAPYARFQYYSTAETRPYDGNRGAKWFERMKAAERQQIIEGAMKL